jgi:hypothetical protein
MRDERGTEPKTYGVLSPEDALSLIGNDIRASILWELSEARAGEGAPAALSFSELRSRVAADADSSQFNYHLQQLVGQFVERVEEGSAQLVDEVLGDADEGYALRPEGTTLTREVRAWTLAGEPTVDPFEVGVDCEFCSHPLAARYENSIFMVRCPECEYLYEYDLVPPGVVADENDETLARAGQFLRDRRVAFARGTCPRCAHGLDAAFVDPAETGYPRTDRRAALLNWSCPNCGDRNYTRVGETLLREPELVTFCRERGLDVTRTPIWELPFAATDRRTEVRATEPWEVALSVELGGDALELVVDGDGAVAETSRR